MLTDESVCYELRNAAGYGKLDDVVRLVPLAKAKHVLNKVCVCTVYVYEGRSERGRKEGRDGREGREGEGGGCRLYQLSASS